MHILTAFFNPYEYDVETCIIRDGEHPKKLPYIFKKVICNNLNDFFSMYDIEDEINELTEEEATCTYLIASRHEGHSFDAYASLTKDVYDEILIMGRITFYNNDNLLTPYDDIIIAFKLPIKNYYEYLEVDKDG